MTIRHVVFDIGKVLIHWDPGIPFKRIIPDQKEREWFLANVCNGAWNLEQDRGRSWADAEAVLIEQHPDHAGNIRAYRENWLEMVPHAHQRSVDLMLRLIGEGRDVTMLTNFASDTFRMAQERYDFLKEPRGVTVSGDIGLIKPDPAIFEHHENSFGIDRASTLFIDDSPHNVKAAQNAGWQTIHLTDPNEITAKTAKFGL